MRKVRVLIVDDSSAVRRLVGEALASDPGMEVVGTAANGRIALEVLAELRPDVLILDIDMPEMDGLQTLAAVRKSNPDLPVLMFSTLTHRGAAATLNALALGAKDYVPKPTTMSGIADGAQGFRDLMIAKIKLFCDIPGLPDLPGDQQRPPVFRTPHPVSPSFQTAQRIDVVAIGVSTGGPNALAEILPALPANFPVPVLVVQHMPPVFTRHLCQRLTGSSALHVTEGEHGRLLEPSQVWVAPGDYHMSVLKDALGPRLQLHQARPENSCRPSVDVLFRSVAEAYGHHALAVVLTGMGQDGLKGCECIRQAGGHVLVQDEESSVIWGMPGFVARAGLANEVLPLSRIGEAIVLRAWTGRSVLEKVGV